MYAKRSLFFAWLLVLALCTPPLEKAHAASAAEIDQDASIALERLYKAKPKAKSLADQAVAILVFPKIVKAGLIVGGAYGEGVLRRGGKSVGYYNSVAASYGLQAGGQSFGYVMFFMNEESVNYLNSSDGWEVGAGPSVVVLEDGFGMKSSSTTLSKDVYAVIFNQSGLMAGIGLEGSKISKIKR
ncbi:lipid-binding SYLF domain-containing protein [Limibacillus halophilus]|jgi:lipid-binding SYLF domain-containing protein